MLLLLSSLARRRYRDDIVRALALPTGAELRFRYGEQYIQSDILQGLIAKGAPPSPGLICHLAEEATSAILVPCRFVSVQQVRRVGTSYIFDLQAEDFVGSLNDVQLRASMKPPEISRLPVASSGTHVPNGNFVLDVGADLRGHRAPDALGMEAFEKTTQALRAHGFDAEDPTAFYSVRRLAASGAHKPKLMSDGTFKLRSGERYLLDVYTYAPESEDKPSDAMGLTIGAEAQDVSFASATNAKLDSRYDLHQFIFSTERRLFALSTGLQLALTVPDKADTKTIEQRCDVVLEVVFRGSVVMAAVRVAMIAMGTAAPAVIGAYAAGKGSLGLAALMLGVALLTGIGTVFPALTKA